ncbi:hypothetical protein, partial [Carnobacterium mobile]
TKLNKQLKANFNKFSHINASFCEVKACINVTLGFGTFLLSLDIFYTFSETLPQLKLMVVRTYVQW